MIRLNSIEISITLAAILIGILLISLRRQKGIGYSSTIAYAVCLSIVAISWFAVSQVSNLQVINVLKIIINFILGYLPAFVFIYILGYTTQSQRLSYRILLVLAFIPAFLLVVFVAQSVPGIRFFDSVSQNFMIISQLDVWGWLMLVYSISMLAASIIVTISTSGNNLKPLRVRPLVALNGAILASIVLDSVSFTNLAPMITEYDLMLVGFTLIGGALLYTDFKIHPINLTTWKELFDNINDGIIVLNNKDEILDLNPAAEQLIGIPTHRACGISVEEILTNWNSISGSNDAKEIEFRGSINLNKQWRHISVRVNKLNNGERGKVIILRDITDRKGTNESRQRAREEMFNLLRSFFKSANTSATSGDFFRDVLFQIAYTFRAESGAICLAEPLPDAKKFKFSVMAKHGVFVKDNDTLTSLHETLDATKWLLGDKEPLIISSADENESFAKLIQQFGYTSIAIFPLLYNEQLLGVLMLARVETTGFTSDEIFRLGVVTEELGSFIYTDRKRKSDIALAERHRLVQDLHDSITQKLYGLLTLTEAVKLGLESGASVDGNRIDRIIENARQALREMRLFLFELEPVDIERDGLVSILHQRLASVEGRSNIQARVVSDGQILLSTEKETEIYYIVEEALNNILKHANAKSVLVKLKQRKESIYLEIVDNGCGFSPDNIKVGGKGLENIRDRAKRIKGKLKIASSPDHGTKITLVVPQ
ncbi:MAG: PAS domain S-box protein [Chloroflexi bacterium]|nr:PAS domain S-box protein [Chloroflexota bacterium]